MNWDLSKLDYATLAVRPAPVPHEEFNYPVRKVHAIEPPTSTIATDYLRQRRTHRAFGVVSLSCVGNLLWHVCSPVQMVSGDFGEVELRPAMSAGARHPVDFLIIESPTTPLFRYRPETHSLEELQSSGLSIELWRRASKLLDLGQGTLLWMVAQPGRTLAKYEHGEAFVLMDVGALAATISFAAAALALAYCPLGISGEPVISEMLGSKGVAIGVLGGVVGSRC